MQGTGYRWAGEVLLQLIAYHVRLLEQADPLTLDSTRPRRGVLEHFYRASPRAAKRLRETAKAFEGLAGHLAAE